MLGRKRLLSALLAGVVGISSLGVSTAAFAADNDDKNIMTFDGQHDMIDYVDYDLIDTENDYEIQEKIEAAIKKAAGVYRDKDLTYGDLAKVRTLNLSGLDLVDVPSCINYMVNMTRLDLSSNLLKSEDLKKLSLVGCTKLSNINLSNNYLTNMPSWFVSNRVTTGNITQNFVDSNNPRYIEAAVTSYYLMNGEEVNEDNLKNQILKSIRMNNGKLLPERFFDYNSFEPPYPVDADKEYPYDLKIGGTWESFTVADTENPDIKKVNAPQNKTIEVTVQLFNEDENANTKTTVTIYLLSGKDLPSLKLRLTGLKAECDALDQKAYTASSWENFTRALDTADAILQYDKADVQMLTNAMDALIAARDSLHRGTEELKKMLDGLIAVGGSYKQENYTPSSWAAFSEALERLRTIAADNNATIETAQSAVKSFQRAQAGLRSAELSVPAAIRKADFEKIYGEDKSITASGITQAGTSYKWTFYGKDLQAVADFNPEVKDTDANESKILLEAGSSSGYRMFATSGNNALPGKATLEIDVSDKFTAGDFYLYKWNGNRSQMAGTTTVTDGKATIPLTEGGVYYLSRKVQNFELKSDTYQVDDAKKTVTILPTNAVSANNFKRSFEFGSYTTILDAEEKPVPSDMEVKTGMTINAPNMDKYSILIVGDVNNNGQFDLSDLSIMLGDYMNAATVENLGVYDMNGDAVFNLKDISTAIGYYMS